MTVNYPLPTAWVVGVLAHLLYFKRGEHHLAPQRYVIALAASFLAGVVLIRSFILSHKLSTDWAAAVLFSTQIHACFLHGLFSSLVVYRLFFHPLNKFPGPIAARVSTFWLSYHVRGFDSYIKIAALHDEYGPFVRITPCELSIRDPKGVMAIHGPFSKCEKGERYDLIKPMTSLHSFRDRSIHNEVRRVWSQAFSEKALRGYEQRMLGYRNMLFDRITAAEGQPIDIMKWLRFYSFDVMGDLSFGKSFNMLETSRNHWAIEILDTGLMPEALHLPMWLLRFALAIPMLSRDWWRYIHFCRDSMLDRMKYEPEVPDIMSTLLSPLKGREPSREEKDMLIGDSQLIIAAGSHTSSATMASMLYELARHPYHFEKLRQELVPLVRDSRFDPSPDELAHLEHLNAVINESLRLHPPVPATMFRVTPPEGIMVGDVFVPGNMNVMCPQYALGRNEAIYSKAESFVPERWYEFPDMVKHKEALSPFSTGPFSCIGKRLALNDIRLTIARLIWTYDIAFPPGEYGDSFERDAVDAFLITYGELRMTFKLRGPV